MNYAAFFVTHGFNATAKGSSVVVVDRGETAIVYFDRNDSWEIRGSYGPLFIKVEHALIRHWQK